MHSQQNGSPIHGIRAMSLSMPVAPWIFWTFSMEIPWYGLRSKIPGDRLKIMDGFPVGRACLLFYLGLSGVTGSLAWTDWGQMYWDTCIKRVVFERMCSVGVIWSWGTIKIKKGGHLKVWVGRAYEDFERFGWGPGWVGYVRQSWNSSCLAIAWIVLRLWGFLCVLCLTQLRLSCWPPHFCFVFPSRCLARPKAGWGFSLWSSSGSPRRLVKKWETGGSEVTGDSNQGT